MLAKLKHWIFGSYSYKHCRNCPLTTKLTTNAEWWYFIRYNRGKCIGCKTPYHVQFIWPPFIYHSYWRHHSSLEPFFRHDAQEQYQEALAENERIRHSQEV